MKAKDTSTIYTANENDKMISIPTELEARTAYKRYEKFKNSGVIELDMCCYDKSELIEVLSYQRNSIDDISGYRETLYYINSDRFLRVLEECDALSGEIFNFDKAYNWVIKYYDATMSKSYFNEYVQNAIKPNDNNAFFDKRVEKWKANPDSDSILSQEVRDGKHPDLLPFLYMFVDKTLPIDIGSGHLTVGPRPKSFSKKYLEKKRAEDELNRLYGEYARLPKNIMDSDYIYMKSHLKEEIELCNKIRKLETDEYQSSPASFWIEQLLYVAVCSVSLKELNDIQKISDGTNAQNMKVFSEMIEIAKGGYTYREKFMNILEVGTEYKQTDLRKIYDNYLKTESEHYGVECESYIPKKFEYLVNESVDAGLWKKENRKNRVFITRLR